jgi:L-lactate dehydrogenase
MSGELGMSSRDRGLDDRHKVVIVGAGRVGSTTAYAALIGGLADHLVLVDQDHARAQGEAMDLVHGLPYLPPARVEAGDFAACADADLVVLTAGVARQAGDTRLDLSRRNLDLYREIVPAVMTHGFSGVFLIVANPVDLVTLAVHRLSGLEAARVIGTGTTLDTARLRSLLAQHFHIDARNVHAYVVGEHGETEVPVWSLARISNLPVADFARALGMSWSAEQERSFGEQVRKAGGEVIRRKGATHYAIALATVRIARTVLRDQRSILTVSAVQDGEQSIEGVALSLPCVLGRAGRINTIPLPLSPGERSDLDRSARVLREAYEEASGPP